MCNVGIRASPYPNITLLIRSLRELNDPALRGKVCSAAVSTTKTKTPCQGKSMTNKARRNSPCIRVWVTPEEKALIKKNADATGQSLSSFLRNIGMGIEPKSTLDQQHTLQLLKASADLGRLGGLLKMWLTNDERFSVFNQSIRNIDDLYEAILKTQAELNEKIKTL